MPEQPEPPQLEVTTEMREFLKMREVVGTKDVLLDDLCKVMPESWESLLNENVFDHPTNKSRDDLLREVKRCSQSVKIMIIGQSPPLRTHPSAKWEEFFYYFQVPGDADFVELVIVIVPPENSIRFGLCKYQQDHHKAYKDWHVRGGPLLHSQQSEQNSVPDEPDQTSLVKRLSASQISLQSLGSTNSETPTTQSDSDWTKISLSISLQFGALHLQSRDCASDRELSSMNNL